MSSAPPTTLPFATLLKPKESNTFARFVEELSDCMTERGFDFPPAPPSVLAPVSRTPAQTRSDRQGYGVVDGLVFEEQPSETADQDPLGDPLSWLDEYAEGLSTGEQERFLGALYGDGSQETSCQAQAEQRMAEGDVFADANYDRIFDEYFDRINSDAELRRQTERWQACVTERTDLLAGIEPKFPLSRDNIEQAVRADISIRAGRSVRLVTKVEADQIDTGALADPWELNVDAVTNVGFLMVGPMSSSVDFDGLVEREVEIRKADDACWQQSGGDKRVAELQAETLEKIENLEAAQS